jgi:hypothetical protein
LRIELPIIQVLPNFGCRPHHRPVGQPSKE